MLVSELRADIERLSDQLSGQRLGSALLRASSALRRAWAEPRPRQTLKSEFQQKIITFLEVQ